MRRFASTIELCRVQTGHDDPSQQDVHDDALDHTALLSAPYSPAPQHGSSRCVWGGDSLQRAYGLPQRGSRLGHDGEAIEGCRYRRREVGGSEILNPRPNPCPFLYSVNPPTGRLVHDLRANRPEPTTAHQAAVACSPSTTPQCVYAPGGGTLPTPHRLGRATVRRFASTIELCRVQTGHDDPSQQDVHDDALDHTALLSAPYSPAPQHGSSRCVWGGDSLQRAYGLPQRGSRLGHDGEAIEGCRYRRREVGGSEILNPRPNPCPFLYSVNPPTGRLVHDLRANQLSRICHRRMQRR